MLEIYTGLNTGLNSDLNSGFNNRKKHLAELINRITVCLDK